MKTAEPLFTIGQMAQLTGLTRRALRLYEQAGLLVPLRLDNSYRCYTEQHLKDARMIREMRAGGLSLDVIGQLITIKQTNATVQEKLSRILVLLDEMHAELITRRQAIDAALRQLEAHQQEAQAALAALMNQETEKRSG